MEGFTGNTIYAGLESGEQDTEKTRKEPRQEVILRRCCSGSSRGNENADMLTAIQGPRKQHE